MSIIYDNLAGERAQLISRIEATDYQYSVAKAKLAASSINGETRKAVKRLKMKCRALSEKSAVLRERLNLIDGRIQQSTHANNGMVNDTVAQRFVKHSRQYIPAPLWREIMDQALKDGES